MTTVDRANERLVDHRVALGGTVEASRLAARLGRWAHGDGTLTVRLAATIGALIEGGELRPGDRLPAERALATAIAVSRGTVVAAYALLSEDELVERRQGSGTRVAGHIGPALPARERRAQGEGLFSALPSGIDLLRAVPTMPDLAVEIVRAHTPTLDPVTLAETDPAGLPALRGRLARLFEEDGTPATAAQILVTHGAQQAISLVVDELVSPGDVVLTESVTWPGLADSVRRRGGRVHGVTIGPDGIDVDELEAAIVALRPVMIAVNPHHHNPTGTRLPAAGRQRIADLSAEYGVPVLEDRVLAHISFDGVVPPTLAALRPDAPIIVVDSLSKWSWSGLRIGWVRADPVLVRRLRGLRQLVDQSTSVPAQLLALDLVEQARALRTAVGETHAVAASRLRAAMAEHLPDWEAAPPRGGLAMWARLPVGSATALSRVASMRGVAVAGGTEFTASVTYDDHIRLPYTAPHDVLDEGIRRLGEAWREYRAQL
ncbi:PLP-dependent aminotransferase family protein [Microbacterium sp. M3]|uniref:PLP-dependent aminotransferase family protein n=1 Tax=Microbacterium arthrosphaerae TaxID=792652 RepID=A0ABU4GYI3_9MICO|nr:MULTISPECIES: PLP-dependent aminotransferase family protein [Microbacterium]MDW4572132.1 PLP-dependent aminotransferase family protein [Microbacterium arthrosphaerae]MDW7605987.1 PLP-dependent aminotransferase family protein [Microbacterium sp. M3]